MQDWKHGSPNVLLTAAVKEASSVRSQIQFTRKESSSSLLCSSKLVMNLSK